MPEHLIRLRGAWQWRHSSEAEGEARRIDLPVPQLPWNERLEPIVLARRFRRPPLDPDRERLLLRMARVPGLRRLILNDQDLTPAWSSEGTSAFDLPITAAIAPWNLLRLVVYPSPEFDDADREGWGSIALVVVCR